MSAGGWGPSVRSATRSPSSAANDAPDSTCTETSVARERRVKASISGGTTYSATVGVAATLTNADSPRASSSSRRT